MMKKINLILLLLFVVNIAFSQLKLHSTGNLTLGTFYSDGTGKFMINDELSHNGGLRIGNTYGFSLRLYRKWDGNNYYGYVTRGGYDDRGIRIDDDGNLVFRTSNNSNYGVLQKSIALQLNSKSYVVDYFGNHNFYVYGNGNAYAYGYQTLSDKRLKENIKIITNPLDKVMKLEGVTYSIIKPTKDLEDKKSEIEETGNEEKLNDVVDDVKICDEIRAQLKKEESSRDMGLIANEVELVVPEVVRTTTEGYKTVSYQNLVGLLIEAMKEQQGQIEGLKKSIEEMQLVSETKSNKIDAYLFQNKPNPTSTNTVINMFLEENIRNATLSVCNLEGKQLALYHISERGNVSYTILASEFDSGIYIYSLVTDEAFVDSKKMIITD